MSDYISKSELKKLLTLNNKTTQGILYAVIDSCKTVDLVQCMDCQYRNKVGCPAYRKLSDTGEIITPPYIRFCSYGERKDGEK